MTLIVEDGSGLSDAESYVSVADASSILSKFGMDSTFSGLTTTEQEIKLRKATRFIDMRMDFVSDTLTDTQALAFPRKDFTDKLGRKVSAIPTALKEVTAFVASENFDPLNENEAAVVSESFGDSDIEYAHPQKSNDADKHLRYLKTLGYGSGGNNVRIWRA